LGHLLDPLYLTRCPMKLCPNGLATKIISGDSLRRVWR
jgi:hypothetical protein